MYRMVPTRELLKASDLLCRDIDNRLVMDRDCLVGDRCAKIELDQSPDLHPSVHRFLEGEPSIASLTLRRIESHVRVRENRFRIRAVERSGGTPNARTNYDFVPIDY